MHISGTDIPGCFRLNARVGSDARGSFVKSYEAGRYAQFGLRHDWREEIHTISNRGVLRGMHFQTPPAEHAKLLFCIAGAVIDVVVDLRRGSPTFGEHRAFELNAEEGDGLYIPSGLAHGFVCVAQSATLFYKMTGEYSPAHDAGIAWDSFGFDWPVQRPMLSARDQQHPRLAAYQSPFLFDASEPAR
jgi:dTDP-4-dehydrorhamnose 3,5-epimerase